jgi:hypothetical protein
VRVRLKTRIMDKKIKDISKLSKNDYGRLERKREREKEREQKIEGERERERKNISAFVCDVSVNMI